MVFETILATESLLTVIAGLLGLLNFNQSRVKFHIAEDAEERKKANYYRLKGIQLRQRINAKLDWLMKKAGADTDQFNLFLDKELNGDLDDEYNEYLNGDKKND